MNPILYESDETSFTSNGLGRLSDCVSCKVTEARNGEYELQMKYPVTGKHYEDIADERIILAVPADGKDAQPFVIYRQSKPMKGIVTVYAQHISYRLNYIPVRPFTAANASDAMQCLSTYAATECPFSFWTDVTTQATCQQDVPGSIRSRLGGTEGSLLDCYGGELEWDKWTVKLHAARGINRGVKIRYGKNLIDLLQEHNLSNVVTAVYPYWYKDDVYYELPERVVSATHDFAWSKVEVVDITEHYENQPTETQMRNWASNYLAGKQDPSDTVKFSFVALWQTKEYENIAPLERVNLCDTVTISYELLGVETTSKVVKTVYDVLKERYESIEVGQGRTNLASTIIEATKSSDGLLNTAKSWFDAAIDHATEMIRGGLGGYVVMNADADGNPQEIIVMDQPSTETAVNCIRINKNGIGFSTNGYEGPFNSAWLIDGTLDAQQINVINLSANSITSGTMSANRIKGGTLTLGGALNTNGSITVTDADNNDLMSVDRTGIAAYGGRILQSDGAEGTGKYVEISEGTITVGDGVTETASINGAATWTDRSGTSYAGMDIIGPMRITAQSVSIARGTDPDTAEHYIAMNDQIMVLTSETVGGETQEVWRTFRVVNGLLAT